MQRSFASEQLQGSRARAKDWKEKMLAMYILYKGMYSHMALIPLEKRLS